jgi:hypothetical protein
LRDTVVDGNAEVLIGTRTYQVRRAELRSALARSALRLVSSTINRGAGVAGDVADDD